MSGLSDKSGGFHGGKYPMDDAVLMPARWVKMVPSVKVDLEIYENIMIHHDTSIITISNPTYTTHYSNFAKYLGLH